MKNRAIFIILLILIWLAVVASGCTNGRDQPSTDRTSSGSGTGSATSQEQSSKQTTTQAAVLSIEQTYATTAMVIETASQRLHDIELAGAPHEQALNQVVAWLSEQAHISSAGLSSDGYTIWMNFDYGINAVLMTRLRGEIVPDDYAAQYDAYQASLSASSIRLFNLPARSAEPEHSAISLLSGMTLPAFDPSSQLLPGPVAQGGVGCSAWIFAPFQWESLTDPNKIIEIDTIRQHYALAALVGAIPFDIDLANVFYNEAATIDSLGAAISGHTGPAIILEINTHGGLDTRNGPEFTYLLSGEELTPEKYLQWFDELQNGLLTWGGVGGKSFLAITPEFVKKYSGTPQPAEDHYLVRYVHINACNSFRPSLINAFLENGAVVYSGYTNPVGWKFGAESTIEFFQNLATLMDVQQAWDEIAVKTDPQYPNCDFKIAGNVNARYFYRAFFELDGLAMETPAYGWLVAYDAEDGGAGFYWSLSALEASNKFPAGKLTLQISADHIGRFSATDERVSIHFDDFGTRWSCSREQAKAGKPCAGTIEITEYDDVHGGLIVGTFTAQLVDSHQTDPPYDTKTITGRFTVIRSKPRAG